MKGDLTHTSKKRRHFEGVINTNIHQVQENTFLQLIRWPKQLFLGRVQSSMLLYNGVKVGMDFWSCSFIQNIKPWLDRFLTKQPCCPIKTASWSPTLGEKGSAFAWVRRKNATSKSWTFRTSSNIAGLVTLCQVFFHAGIWFFGPYKHLSNIFIQYFCSKKGMELVEVRFCSCVHNLFAFSDSLQIFMSLVRAWKRNVYTALRTMPVVQWRW